MGKHRVPRVPGRNPGTLGRMSPNLAPTSHPTLREIVWAAGIYEGEGCCGGARSSPRSLVVTLTQKDPWILHRLAQFFGGKVRADHTYWVWDLSGTRGRGFAMTIYGLLSPRRQAQIRKVLHPCVYKTF